MTKQIIATTDRIESITQGKAYNVVSEKEGYATVINDFGKKYELFEEEFEYVEPQEDNLVEIDNIIPFPYQVKVECPDCRGKGLVTAFAGNVQGQHKCPRCNGEGKLKL